MITYLVCDLKKKKQQVGSTVSLETGRPYVHFTDKCPNPVLRNATRKRPEDFFVFISEDDGLSTREAEQEALDFYFGSCWCYNLSPHASGGWEHINNSSDPKPYLSENGKKSAEKFHSERDEEGRSEHAVKTLGAYFTSTEHQRKAGKASALKGACNKAVEVTHIESGETLIFKSAREAARSLNLHQGHLSEVARGECKQHKGYTAKYI